MKTIVAGSSNIQNYKVVCEVIKNCGWIPTEIICGLANGVDKLGEQYAIEHKIPVKYFAADWRTNGRSAGVIRNRQMAEYGEALIAIWDGNSRGTDNMIKTADELGLKVFTALCPKPCCTAYDFNKPTPSAGRKI